jgi:hypothetical protein
MRARGSVPSITRATASPSMTPARPRFSRAPVIWAICRAVRWRDMPMAREGRRAFAERAASYYAFACGCGRGDGLLEPRPVLYRRRRGGEGCEARRTIVQKSLRSRQRTSGCANLGASYSLGKGVAPNQRQAARIFERACKADDQHACYNLGVLHRDGLGMPRDYKRGFCDCSSKAADRRARGVRKSGDAGERRAGFAATASGRSKCSIGLVNLANPKAASRWGAPIRPERVSSPTAHAQSNCSSGRCSLIPTPNPPPMHERRWKPSAAKCSNPAARPTAQTLTKVRNNRACPWLSFFP